MAKKLKGNSIFVGVGDKNLPLNDRKSAIYVDKKDWNRFFIGVMAKK